MKIIKYKVIDQNLLLEITNVVQYMIEQGWQPYGSISCFSSGYNQSDVHYVQAMVKYED